MDLWWAEKDAEHVATRSTRYRAPTTSNSDGPSRPPRTPRVLLREPDSRSRIGHTRVIGWSPSAGAVLTVIVGPRDQSGVTAWKTTGADLREYHLQDRETAHE